MQYSETYLIAHVQFGVFLGYVTSTEATWSRVNAYNDGGAPVYVMDDAMAICNTLSIRMGQPDNHGFWLIPCKADVLRGTRPFLSQPGCVALGFLPWISYSTEPVGRA